MSSSRAESREQSLSITDAETLARSWSLSLRAERKSPQTLKAYADGLRFAADVVHAEARWQTELAMRNVAARHEHRHAADRMSVVEDALRSMAECVAPPCHQCGPGYRIGSEGCHHNEEGSHA